MKFIKMHGIGNDYVFLDCLKAPPPEDPAALSRVVSRFHTGIGSDGVILMLPSAVADCRMRIFNADGSEGMMCGNGIRCIGKYLYEYGYVNREDVTVETKSGLRFLHLNIESNKVSGVRVDMGAPEFVAERIPVNTDKPEALMIRMPDGTALTFFCVSMGNPHAVTFVDDLARIHIEQWGPCVQKNPAFPESVNVEFIRVASRDHLIMRVYERGSGETMACGTGACAALVAAASKSLCDDAATISLAGGDLFIEWNRAQNRVYKTGPACIAFTGEWIGDCGDHF